LLSGSLGAHFESRAVSSKAAWGKGSNGWSGEEESGGGELHLG